MRILSLPQFIGIALGLLPARILAGDTLSTNGVTSCLTSSDIQVQKLDVTYTRSTGIVVFDVAGTNYKEQNVTASLSVTAYGNVVYTKDIDPCSSDNYIQQLCPVPSGSFSATGSESVPAQFASMIPSIAYTIPDLDGQATLQLKSLHNTEVGCIQSELTNGNSMHIPAISYVAVGVAGTALAMSGLSALGAAGHAGAASSSPGFGNVMGWFHSMATNGMLSVSYPTVYQSFAKNFVFSTGLVPWGDMQTAIDNFRKSTGGNLTENSYEYLVKMTSGSSKGSNFKRGLNLAAGAVDLFTRDISSSFDNSTSTSSAVNSTSNSTSNSFVSGINRISTELTIPQANTFMTVLLIFAIVVAVITAGVLLLKVILEVWAKYGSFPEKLSDFREDYWGLLARTITSLILILYGIWVLYCVYQLRNGDSWAAKLLAAVTLAIFTGVLLFFGFRIMHLARKYKKIEGDTSGLYENQDTWKKYSLFYDNYKKDYWWLFVPAIVYMFAKGCVIAGGDGHGLFQSGGQLVVESLMFGLLLWNRPYVTKSSQWINITIQAVRVLSIACVLVFVEELGISQTTKTATGIVLVAVQSALTGILAILIAVNAIILFIRENPHARRRREAEKLNHDFDDLTPLDARASLLMDNPPRKEYAEMSKFNFTGPYEPYKDQDDSKSRHNRAESTDHLVKFDSRDDHHDRSVSRESRHSHDSHSSIEGHHATTPGYGFAY